MNKILICLVLLVIVISCNQSVIGNKNFTSDEWKKGDKYLRGTMVNDLLKSKELYNKSKKASLDLLGEPNDSTNTTYTYIVNLAHVDNRDDLDCWLTIQFKDGVAQRVWVND